MQVTLYDPYLSASEVVFHEEALYQVYLPLPFNVSVLRPAAQVGPMHKAAGIGKLINAALLSLINDACVNVCCATLLSQLVGPACVQARSSNPIGRACRPIGKGSGEEGILSGVVPVYLYCPAFNVVFL